MTDSHDSAGPRIDKLSGKKARLLDLLLKSRVQSAPKIAPVPREYRDGVALLPAAAAQRRLWLIDRMEGGGAYHVQVAARLHGTLNVVALQQAFRSLGDRHEILRTVFVEVDGEPQQHIQRENSLALELIDLRDRGPSAREMEVCSLIDQEARRSFDLSKGPLCRSQLLQLAVEQHVLLITLHHIVVDAWSIEVLLRELQLLYAAHCDRRASPLEPLSIQYGDYSYWQWQWLQGDASNQQLNYWRSQLSGAAADLNLPTDRARPAVQSYRGDNVALSLGPELTARIKSLAAKHELTMFMTLYAAWALLLARLSGQSDIVIGTPVANRRQPELAGVIGFFVNTVVLRAEVRADTRLDAFLQQIKKITLEAYDNQDIPFEDVVQALQPARTLNRNPLFNVMLVVQNNPTSGLRLSGVTATPERVPAQPAKFDLLLSLEECGNEIKGAADFAMDLYDRDTIERWMGSFIELLQAITRQGYASIGDLPILTERDKQLLSSFNATTTPYQRERLVHELFEQQVERLADEPAVLYGQRLVTYAELNDRAGELARQLRLCGVGRDKLVGIFLERSPEMIIGLLGTLKAGGAYLPLDPNYPRERLEYMLEDAAPSVVLTQSSLSASLPETPAHVIIVDANAVTVSEIREAHVSAAELGSSSQDLAYVIYTSGSTGRPKGTAMPHRPLVNLIEWQRHDLGGSERARVLQFAALSFDVAFQEIFTTLCTGGTLVLLDEWMRKDVPALVELLKAQRVERLFVPPLMLQSLAEHVKDSGAAPESLCDVITAGEQLRISPEIVSMFQQLTGCRLHNHYGPTETHVVTSLTLEGEPSTWPMLPAIGRPIANTRIYVLDTHRCPQPVGVSGEIYIAGDAPARGYPGRPELTAERFLKDPFDVGADAVMYRTGDIGAWGTDRVVRYMGRNDHQVKIRGFRIELAEVEAQLASYPQVIEAAVIAREDTPGGKRLVAYVVPRHPAVLSAAILRDHLRSVLPDYMVPGAFVMLERLPVTPSGKLDRRSLPPPASNAFVSTQSEPPKGEVEAAVARIWQELLRTDCIGRQDNFFELGGHSLLAVKALSRINRGLGSTLKVTDFYKHPTVQKLAGAIAGNVVEDELINLSCEAVLDDTLVVHPGLRGRRAGAVLMTGATGFVGRFLLAQLLEDTDATIYCLLRAATRSEAAERVHATLAQWDLWRPEFESRLIAIPGDLRQPRLGLDEHSYSALCQNVDSIYHCATSMNHLETYSMAKPANVDSASELVALATRHRLKLINFISTLGVFRSPPDSPSRIVNEHTPIDLERHRSSQGYVASKWVGEKIFMRAQERGVPCNIFRLGLIWADTHLGRYDELQHDYRVIKSCLLSGYGIRNHRYITPPTPVDFVARAVVFLAARYPDGRGIFHISSPRQEIADLFRRCNEIAGTSLELLSMYQWVKQVKRLHEQGQSLPVLPLIEAAFSLTESAFEQQQKAIYGPSTRYDCSATYRELGNGNIIAPVLNDDLLLACLRSMCMRDADVRTSKAGASIGIDAEYPSDRLRSELTAPVVSRKHGQPTGRYPTNRQ